MKAVLHFTESPGLPSNEDVTHEPIEGVGSTANGHDVMIFYTIVPQFNFQISNYGSLKFVIGSYTKVRISKFCPQLASNF